MKVYLIAVLSIFYSFTAYSICPNEKANRDKPVDKLSKNIYQVGCKVEIAEEDELSVAGCQKNYNCLMAKNSSDENLANKEVMQENAALYSESEYERNKDSFEKYEALRIHLKSYRAKDIESFNLCPSKLELKRIDNCEPDKLRATVVGQSEHTRQHLQKIFQSNNDSSSSRIINNPMSVLAGPFAEFARTLALLPFEKLDKLTAGNAIANYKAKDYKKLYPNLNEVHLDPFIEMFASTDKNGNLKPNDALLKLVKELGKLNKKQSSTLIIDKLKLIDNFIVSQQKKLVDEACRPKNYSMQEICNSTTMLHHGELVDHNGKSKKATLKRISKFFKKRQVSLEQTNSLCEKLNLTLNGIPTKTAQYEESLPTNASIDNSCLAPSVAPKEDKKAKRIEAAKGVLTGMANGASITSPDVATKAPEVSSVSVAPKSDNLSPIIPEAMSAAPASEVRATASSQTSSFGGSSNNFQHESLPPIPGIHEPAINPDNGQPVYPTAHSTESQLRDVDQNLDSAKNELKQINEKIVAAKEEEAKLLEKKKLALEKEIADLKAEKLAVKADIEKNKTVAPVQAVPVVQDQHATAAVAPKVEARQEEQRPEAVIEDHRTLSAPVKVSAAPKISTQAAPIGNSGNAVINPNTGAGIVFSVKEFPAIEISDLNNIPESIIKDYAEFAKSNKGEYVINAKNGQFVIVPLKDPVSGKIVGYTAVREKKPKVAVQPKKEAARIPASSTPVIAPAPEVRSVLYNEMIQIKAP